MSAEKNPSVWTLVDNRAGNEGQCLGVAEALGWPYEVRRLDYNLFGTLPNVMLGATFETLTPACRRALGPPWPDLVIAAGRRAAAVARRIKDHSNGRAFLVQIMYPGRAGAEAFDLIAVPRHDGMDEAANIVAITGAPNRITAKLLRAAAKEWRPRLQGLPKPWIALLVGGSTRRRRFTEEMARDLGRTASRLAADAGGALLVSTSRRTGAAARALVDEITTPRYVYGWRDLGDNPYFGYLALADEIIVTGDSVSMCSEACATTAPVYIYAPPGLISHRHARLHTELYDGGYARPLRGPLESWTHKRLDPTGQIVAAIKERFGRG